MAVSIAIDGHAGAGKGTLATGLSKELNFLYLDTGAMYRSLAIVCLRANLTSQDEEKIKKIISDINYVVEYKNGTQVNIVEGEDVTPFIRTEQVGMMASSISAYPFVREKLVSMQREIANNIDVILEGRDIGTVVLPNADFKFFLTASPEVRAKRRMKQLSLPENEFDKILELINKRDYQDQNREHSPLKKAENAILVDNTNMTIEEVVNFCLSYIKK